MLSEAVVKEKRREYYLANKERIKENSRAWRRRNPDYDRKRKRKYCEENRDRVRAHHARWREKHRERLRAAGRLYYKNNAEKYRAYQRKKFYGLSPDDFLSMLERQNHECALCTKKLLGGRETHIDHDHVTGKVRGLLCNHHNTALGAFGDSVEGLLAAVAYLERGV